MASAVMSLWMLSYLATLWRIENIPVQTASIMADMVGAAAIPSFTLAAAMFGVDAFTRQVNRNSDSDSASRTREFKGAMFDGRDG